MSLATTKQALARWHDMVTTRDMSILNELLAEDVVFRSPVAFNPYPGKQVVFFILTNVIQVFENFTYHRLACLIDQNDRIPIESDAFESHQNMKDGHACWITTVLVCTFPEAV